MAVLPIGLFEDDAECLCATRNHGDAKGSYPFDCGKSPTADIVRSVGAAHFVTSALIVVVWI